MNTKLPHAVVLGLSPTGLYVARELGRAGVPLLGVANDFSCGSVSRYFLRGSGVWHEPDLDKLLDRLISYSERLELKPVIFPTSDFYIEFIIKNFAVLKKHFRVAECYGGAADDLLDKAKFHRLCAERGVDTPDVLSASELRFFEEYFDDIKFPCILKPALIHQAKPYMAGKKVIVVNTLGELKLLMDSIPTAAGGWLLQEIIPGRESVITLVAGYSSIPGEAQDLFTARKLRQYPPGFGSASKVISEACEESRDITEQLINSIGFRGVFGAEFKYDERDGKQKIIEINPRPTLWFSISHAAGKRIAERAYCDLAGLPVPVIGTQRNGIVWTYVLKDFVSSMKYKYRADKLDFPPPNLSEGGRVKKRCWPVFSLSDPLPFFAESIVYVIKYVERWF